MKLTNNSYLTGIHTAIEYLKKQKFVGPHPKNILYWLWHHKKMDRNYFNLTKKYYEYQKIKREKNLLKEYYRRKSIWERENTKKAKTKH